VNVGEHSGFWGTTIPGPCILSKHWGIKKEILWGCSQQEREFEWCWVCWSKSLRTVWKVGNEDLRWDYPWNPFGNHTWQWKTPWFEMMIPATNLHWVQGSPFQPWKMTPEGIPWPRPEHLEGLLDINGCLWPGEAPAEPWTRSFHDGWYGKRGKSANMVLLCFITLLFLLLLLLLLLYD